MEPVLLRIVIGALLVVHGVAHVDITRVWGARSTASSWVLGEAGAVGTALPLLALAGFSLAGLALFVGLDVWRPLAVVAACASLATIALYWDVQMVLGVAVNVGILIALLWVRWPEQGTLSGSGT
ncbi:MAG TPA: hypothetical protein VFM58_20875 [Solirubrobacteraceae bacterium]|nr:hypothetical protein [Solirubrobacteraceae bacterium]